MADKIEVPQPLFLVKPGTIKRPDIRRAEKNCGITIVECSDPESARYSVPPITANIHEQARAALELFRWIASGDSGSVFYQRDMTKYFVKLLLEGSKPIAAEPVKQIRK
jgi:hypothetical protein